MWFKDDKDESDSDYIVENYVKPDVVKPSINDESADILGNFDNSKNIRDDLAENDPLKYELLNRNDNRNENSSSDGLLTEETEEICNKNEITSKNLSRDQIRILLKGARKSNRFVLYVTNLSYETTTEKLEEYFSSAGNVKSVRIPKTRKGGFAFVEMLSEDDLKNALELHNTELDGRLIKTQISEGGKKKSANKKNILKQKNRKLAEMRNEDKSFSKSGKNYDKSIKKEKEKEFLQRKRWRKLKSIKK